ncbi:unnamed protein product [Rotaria sp. Silwood1]|nr:unnamed protein product [Rotaria sp. Silwood1]
MSSSRHLHFTPLDIPTPLPNPPTTTDHQTLFPSLTSSRLSFNKIYFVKLHQVPNLLWHLGLQLVVASQVVPTPGTT